MVWFVCCDCLERAHNPLVLDSNRISVLVGAFTQHLSGAGLSFVGSRGGEFGLPDKSRTIAIKALSLNCRECRVVWETRGWARKQTLKQNLRLGWRVRERTADARRICPADRGPERRSRKLPRRRESAARRSKRDQTVTGQCLIRSAIRVTTRLPSPTTSVLRCFWWPP